MSSVFEILAVGLAATAFFGVVLGFIAFMRWLRYKETIELAQRGLIHPLHEARATRRMNRTRRSGIITAAIGAAMTLGLGTIGLDPHTPLLGPWLLGGLIPLSIGIGLIATSRSDDGGRSAEMLPDDDSIPPHKLQ